METVTPVLAHNVWESREEELEAEVAALKDTLTAVQWARMKDRFYALDAIKDDRCPCCGARVRAVETHNSVKLEAINPS